GVGETCKVKYSWSSRRICKFLANPGQRSKHRQHCKSDHQNAGQKMIERNGKTQTLLERFEPTAALNFADFVVTRWFHFAARDDPNRDPSQPDRSQPERTRSEQRCRLKRFRGYFKQEKERRDN